MIKLLLVEDGSIPSAIGSLCKVADPSWEIDARHIKDKAGYRRLLKSFSEGVKGPLIAAFDLDYTTAVSIPGAKLKHFHSLSPKHAALLGEQARHGFNALMTCLHSVMEGDVLAVVCSVLDTGVKTGCGEPIAEAIRSVATQKRGTATIFGPHPSGSLIRGNIQERLQGIADAWQAYFGCTASRIRANGTRFWFNDRTAPFPACMVHASNPNDLCSRLKEIRNYIAPWLAALLKLPESDAYDLIEALSTNRAFFSFYKNALQHLTGACALHSGRSGGKPLNMHGLALIACAYANNVASVFKRIDWKLIASETLIDPGTSVTDAEALLYALVGVPGDGQDPQGLFDLLGIHTGQDIGTQGKRTVKKVVLHARSVEVTFGINGKKLVRKLKSGSSQGGALMAMKRLQAMLRPAVSLKWSGTSDFLKLIFERK